MAQQQRVVIIGGGFAGVATALGLERQRPEDGLDITVINRKNFFLYHPLLPEVCSGGVEPRHVIVPLRDRFATCRLLDAEVVAVDLEARQISLRHGNPHENDTLGYDHLVFALGADANLSLVPGVEANAFTFRSVEDAILLRNQLGDMLEDAELELDAARRAELLTFVVVGGGATGVEVLGEVESFLRAIQPRFRVRPEEIRLILLDVAPHLLAEMGPALGAYALEELRKRGVTVMLETSAREVRPDRLILSDGRELRTRTVIWTIGLAPPALLRDLDLPKDAKGYLRPDATLRLDSKQGFVWALGDCTRLTGEDGKPFPPTAQHAVRQGKQLARNILAVVRGEAPTPYGYAPIGTLVSIGGNKGVAKLWGRELRGWLAWAMWRFTHLILMPSADRRIRIVLDWVLSAFLPRDTAQLVVKPRPAPHEAAAPPLAFLRAEPEAPHGMNAQSAKEQKREQKSGEAPSSGV
jgi:NADH dehydrogenase